MNTPESLFTTKEKVKFQAKVKERMTKDKWQMKHGNCQRTNVTGNVENENWPLKTGKGKMPNKK